MQESGEPVDAAAATTRTEASTERTEASTGQPEASTGQPEVSADRLAALIARAPADLAAAADLVAATTALLATDLLEQDEAYASLRESLVKALAALVTDAASPVVQDDALVALAALDGAAATTACFRLFRRAPAGSDRRAGRWLQRLTGDVDPTIDELVARLPRVDNLQAVLTSRALAERGPDAVPALHAALAALPIPAVPDHPDWWEAEVAKYRIMKALQWLGPAAEPAVPLLIALLDDEHGYRDTRHQATVTLQAIGRPAGRGRGASSPATAYGRAP